MSHATPRGPERRTAERHASDAVVSCHTPALTKRDSLAALVMDVSAQGMSLVLRYCFVPGTPLVIQLGDLVGAPAPVLARVVHVSPRGDGKWVIGCALRQDLNDQQLAACRADAECISLVSVTCASAPEDGW
jgi:hypothetical protein